MTGVEKHDVGLMFNIDGDVVVSLVFARHVLPDEASCQVPHCQSWKTNCDAMEERNTTSVLRNEISEKMVACN